MRRANPEAESLQLVLRNTEVHHGRLSGSVHVSNLQEWFEQNSIELTHDAFFSINDFFRPGTHQASALRSLNAVYLDLDCRDLPKDIALPMIAEAQERGVIPPYSLLQRGGGLWLFWLLRDEADPTVSPRAWPNMRQMAIDVMAELYRRVKTAYPDLAPDPASINNTKLARVEGSWNSRSVTPVRYTLNLDANMRVIRYTLPELAQMLGLEAAPKRTRYSATSAASPAARHPNRRKGRASMFRGRLNELRRIEAARGGFREGCRNAAAYVLALTMQGLGAPEQQIRAAVHDLGASCLPTLSKSECEAKVRAAIDHPKRLRNASIAALLRVTTEEAERLELKKLRPDYRRRDPRGRNAAREHRRSVLAQCCAPDCVKSLRAHVADAAKLGLNASLKTIRADLHALGFHREAQRSSLSC